MTDELEIVEETDPEMTGNYPTVVPKNGIIVEREVEPEVMMAKATKAAKVLQDVVKQAGLAINLGGKKDHLQYEAWVTIGAFNNATPRNVWTKRILDKDGNFFGYEAKAEVVKNGQVISSADAMCTIDEKNWGMRNSKNGMVATPEFQLRSMAQTRAASKALRMVFAWVAVLAGYSPTPADEMTGTEYQKDKPFDPVEGAALLGALPKPVKTTPVTTAGHPCAVCGKSMSQIPAGVSKTSGKPYNAFWACPAKCKQPK